MTKKLSLTVTDLEERIAPSFVFTPGSAPADAGASPVGGQGDPSASFGPSVNGQGTGPSNFAAWTAHAKADVLDFGGE